MGNRLTRSEVVKVHGILQNHLVKADEGHYKYVDGWDDVRVAKEVSSDCQAATIGKLRFELFGRIRAPKVAIDNDRINKIEEKIVELTKQIEQCNKSVEAYKTSYNLLIETLHLNRVGNIKHLKIS